VDVAILGLSLKMTYDDSAGNGLARFKNFIRNVYGTSGSSPTRQSGEFVTSDAPVESAPDAIRLGRGDVSDYAMRAGSGQLNEEGLFVASKLEPVIRDTYMDFAYSSFVAGGGR
jgi:hypothetical protein